MPDVKKLQVLQDAGYMIRNTCGTCVHAEGIINNPQAWGSCERHPSAHEKHTDGARLSTRRDGFCPSYLARPSFAAVLKASGFDRFPRG